MSFDSTFFETKSYTTSYTLNLSIKFLQITSYSLLIICPLFPSSSQTKTRPPFDGRHRKSFNSCVPAVCWKRFASQPPVSRPAGGTRTSTIAIDYSASASRSSTGTRRPPVRTSCATGYRTPINTALETRRFFSVPDR